MDFSERLERYLKDTKEAHTEASKAFLFLEFIRDVFSDADIKQMHNLFPYLEKYLKKKEGILAVKGRADALLGNLIIEFKDELTQQKLDNAKEELKKYVSIIWSNEKERIRYLLITSDGVTVIVYRPKLFQIKLFEDREEKIEITPDRISLEFIDKIRLDRVDPDYAYVWLDRYLLYRELQLPTTENFLSTFGKESPVYGQSIGMLKDKWAEIKDRPQMRLLFDKWEKYLEIVYGSRIAEEALFLRHTYLATLSKLIANMFYSSGALPSPDEILAILSGESFKKWGIQNFLELDFFSWILRAGEDFVTQFCRHLIEHLRSFDITKLDEDVLKGLYQELVDPKERHDLGEYYTPDWLADYIARELIEDPEKRVLDPACGSGTFLVSAIKLKKKALEEQGKDKTEILEEILSQVVGIDIHPLAVITSKVNYLLTLGELIQCKEKPIVIPVYLADSIKLPKYERVLGGIDVYSIKVDSEVLRIPAKIIKSSDIADQVFNTIREIVETEILSKDFEAYLKKRLNLELTKDEYALIVELVEKLKQFKKSEKDSIWTYILKNIYKPIFLSERKFDYLIGNPPWISYRYLGTDYQEYVKDQIIKRYRLLPSEKVELMTHMEFATLFFARASDLYLNDNGKIGFVMPRGIFSSDQHDNFRKGEFLPQIRIENIFDLEKVRPLFNINSCVVFGLKGEKTAYPITGKGFSGKLVRKNASLVEAEKSLEVAKKKFYLNRIGTRSFLLDKEIPVSLRGSYYKDHFNQGATLVPRNFWFVDIQKHPTFGVDPNKPYVKSSRLVMKYAKPPYRDVIMEGNVEKQFLYATLRGSEIVPFTHLPFLIIVLPAEQTRSQYKMINKEEAIEKGKNHLYRWLKRAEEEWTRLRGEKAEKMTIYERLNRFNGIVNQSPEERFKVLYLTSGTYLAACMVDLEKEDLKVCLDGISIPLNGFVADTKTYYFETNKTNEAYYLVSILNAPIVDDLIKGMQSRGLFGPRDIHKKVLDLPIPKFDSDNPTHMELSKLGRKCKKKAEDVLPSIIEKNTSIACVRRKIKEELSEERERISELTLEIFSEATSKGTLERWK